MVPMPPPVDRDVVMGPPPLPPQITLSGSGDSRSRENQEIADKYKKLKRKFRDMDEVRVLSDVSLFLLVLILTWPRASSMVPCTEAPRDDHRATHLG